MLGDPCRPQAQGDRCDRRSVRPLHPAGHSRLYPVRQRTGVPRQGSTGMDRGCRCQGRLHRARQPRGERVHRELQRSPARRAARRRNLLHSPRGPNRHRELAAALQHDQAARIARIQAASSGGICPCLRRVAGCATPTGSAGHASATASLKLTFHLDHSVGANHLGVTVAPGLYGLSTKYTLLTAGAISGQFAQFISSPPSAFLSLSGPIYNPDPSVDVTMTRTPFGAVAGLTANQRAVGNALEAGYSTTRTGPAATLYTNLLMTGTPDALSQLSGEIHGSVQSVIVDDSRYIRQAVLGRLRQAPYAGGTGAIAALGSGGPTLAYAESATDAALAYAAK